MPSDHPAAVTDIAQALAAFLKSRSPATVEAGTVLMRQGEASEQAFFLETGSVLVYSETSYGTVPLATLSAPRLIGEIGVLADLPRTASIKVNERATIHAIDKAALLAIGQKVPELLLAVVGQLGRQIDSVNRAVSLYTNALSALEKREFDSGILADLNNPTPQLAEFAATFRRFADQIVDKRRQHDEMASAALIQQSLLPNFSALAALDDVLDFHAGIRPARRVGGDFYDFFALDEERVAIAVSDVCGKGIPASLFMAIVVTILRTAAREEKDVRATILRANAILCMENASCMFATLFFAVLNHKTGHLEYCNCGHNSPLLLSREGRITTLAGSGLPLGLYPDRTPQTFHSKLEPGETLFLFTDGVTEATNSAAGEFGDARLHEAVVASRNRRARELVTNVFAAVDEFAGGWEQSDDITCFAIARR